MEKKIDKLIKLQLATVKYIRNQNQMLEVLTKKLELLEQIRNTNDNQKRIRRLF